MRRKNWINKKKISYDKFGKNLINFKSEFNFLFKIKSPVFDKHNTLERLYRIYLKKNKYSNILVESNYYFYSDMFKTFKFIHKELIYRNFVKSIDNPLIFSPTYTFKSQFFENKFLFNNLLNKFKIKGFFLHKNFFNIKYVVNSVVYKNHLIGYSFFIFNKNSINLNDINKISENKDYNSVGKFKLVYKHSYFFYHNLFNEVYIYIYFNLILLKMLEIYKISIYLYIFLLVN